MCEKFHIQCENPFFLNKIIKTWKTKFTVSSLVLCLVCPSVCPSHIYEKIFFWLFPSAAVDYFKGDTDCLGVMVTVLGLRILLMDDTNCSRITLSLGDADWRWKNFPCCAKNFAYSAKMFFSWIRCEKHKKSNSQSVLWPIALPIHLFVRHALWYKIEFVNVEM